MEEMHRPQNGGRVQGFQVLSKFTPLPEPLGVHQPRRSPTLSFGILWRLHHTSIIDEIIGHWSVIQPPAPLPS